MTSLRKWFSEEHPVDSARISSEVPLDAVYLFSAILILAWMLSLLFMFRARSHGNGMETDD